MGLLDRFSRGARGVPGRALVVVNRSPGPETGKSSLRTRLRTRLRPLPEGSGPEADVSQWVPSHQAHLITSGMEVPVLLDPVTNEPVGVRQDGLDEAIGSYYLGLEPAHGTWEAALQAERKKLRQDTGALGDVQVRPRSGEGCHRCGQIGTGRPARQRARMEGRARFDGRGHTSRG